VQEEYFISGSVSGRPYTTRILIRRPARADRFSGIVIAESIRSTAIRSMWSLRDYFVRFGHAYVEIGSNHLAVNKLLKPADARYGPLDLPAIEGGVFGHVIEVIAQGGMLLKTNPKGGPFTGFRVRRVILAGCSEQGVIIRQYMRDGHPVHRMADGTSICDGYFPACVADWPEPFILVNGQPLKNCRFSNRRRAVSRARRGAAGRAIRRILTAFARSRRERSGPGIPPHAPPAASPNQRARGPRHPGLVHPSR
jgi:hypothetical protein